MEEDKKIKTEKFYKQFNKLGQLEKNLKTKELIHQILTGLKTTPDKEDPGKDDTAFYFVAKITPEDIMRSDSPLLYNPCPSCKRNQPVLMTYEQTVDSPEGDTWEKEAFIFCKDGIHKLAHFVRSYRF